MKKNISSALVTKDFLEERLVKHRDDILSRLDDVMGQLEGMREENTISYHQSREFLETTEDHEKRIKKLEGVQQSA